ncbi:hypothetical protein [Bradyrhizobium sp. CCBAU 51627]|uniref:hypothetical protein n=1 Tax=Bradyrhizobium sp. CCBAU 51627 TaxID=1325088 RepID=UPI0023063E27|nr:hypothetical protein [Bradyrhizobium sp. CCBAU 51627]MDA9436026.1 hypothetical protein [Bradyrhizobium sp. CCBAU 51627]
MPSATIELIVSAYVRLKNRRALDDMRDLRHELLKDLQAASGFDSRRALEEVRKDLRVIEQGLAQLRLPQVTLPENEWR